MGIVLACLGQPLPHPSNQKKGSEFFESYATLLQKSWDLSMCFLPCDFEDSGVPNLHSSSFSRETHHPWRPKSLPQYHRVVVFSEIHLTPKKRSPIPQANLFFPCAQARMTCTGCMQLSSSSRLRKGGQWTGWIQVNHRIIWARIVPRSAGFKLMEQI